MVTVSVIMVAGNCSAPSQLQQDIKYVEFLQDEETILEGNLTKGPILKTLTKLAIPIMASSFLGTLYNITDMAWIGLLGSKEACLPGFPRGWQPWQEWEDRYRLPSALDGAKNKKPISLHRQLYSYRQLWDCFMQQYVLFLPDRW